ncbi:MAG: response regulator transcription factor [Spartobacteria bacterium]|nr:response regulator transcription factor [Spartobacteria bacterium]
MMRVVIVDDQKIERFHMHILFKHCPDVQVVGESDNVKDAAAMINSTQPDAVFLDIDLGKGMTGFDILPLLETDAKIVFVTLYNEYAVRAFKVNALDYIMKPVTIERLSETLVRIHKEIAPHQPQPDFYDHASIGAQDFIHLKEGRRQALVPVNQIVAIEANGDYTRVYTTQNGVYLIRRTMKEWQVMLPEDVFAVLDRKLIVARTQLREIRADGSSVRGILVVADCSQTFELGRTALKEARHVMEICSL